MDTPWVGFETWLMRGRRFQSGHGRVPGVDRPGVRLTEAIVAAPEADQVPDVVVELGDDDRRRAHLDVEGTGTFRFWPPVPPQVAQLWVTVATPWGSGLSTHRHPGR